jgi:hypothetical protein
MASTVSAVSYCQDFLELGNPGGRYTGLKTCDTINPETVSVGDTIVIDIWASDMPESIISSGFEMFYNPAQVNIVSVQAYDGVDIAGGPWDGMATIKIPNAYGPGSYVLGVAQFGCVTPDAGGDIIIARVTFQCQGAGTADIRIRPITGFDTTVGCTSGVLYDTQMGTSTFALTLEGEGINYCHDFLESGNPGGRYTGLKTCDVVNPETVNPGDTFAIDIWATDMPESIISSGFEMFYNPAQVNIVSVQAYDGVDIPGGPWDYSFKMPDPYGPGSFLLAESQFNCAVPDVGGDIIIAKVTFQCLASGSVDISVRAITDFGTTVGCTSGIVYDYIMDTATMTIITEYDSDGDAISDSRDNCPNHPNGPLLGTCTSGPREKIGTTICTSNADCDPNGFCSMNQEDIYPPGGNGVGDACDCEGNFDCDGDVDGSDAFKFKEDFGRSRFFNPCPNCKLCFTTTVPPSTTTTAP